MLKIKKTNKNGVVLSQKTKAMAAAIEKKFKERHAKKSQKESEQAITGDKFRNYTVSIMAPDPIPYPQEQHNPLPAQDYAATVSIPDS